MAIGLETDPDNFKSVPIRGQKGLRFLNLWPSLVERRIQKVSSGRPGWAQKRSQSLKIDADCELTIIQISMKFSQPHIFFHQIRRTVLLYPCHLPPRFWKVATKSTKWRDWPSLDRKDLEKRRPRLSQERPQDWSCDSPDQLPVTSQNIWDLN